MARRLAWLALALIVATGELGCGLLPGRDPWPCGKMWYGCQCGEFWWNEWFSHPPECCDPCDCCGNFTCSHNPFVRHTGPPMGFPYGYPPPGTGIDDGYSMSSFEPTRAEPTLAVPAEELPPSDSAARFNELGQLVSFDEPVGPAPRRAPGAGNAMRRAPRRTSQQRVPPTPPRYFY